MKSFMNRLYNSSLYEYLALNISKDSSKKYTLSYTYDKDIGFTVYLNDNEEKLYLISAKWGWKTVLFGGVYCLIEYTNLHKSNSLFTSSKKKIKQFILEGGDLVEPTIM